MTPRYVNAVRTIQGKVWHVNAPKSVILRLPDNTHQIYTVPNDAKFIVNGLPKTVFDLRKGMNIKATIVTDDTHTVIEQSKAVTGEAPLPQALPQEVGVLLFFAAEQPVAPSAAEQTELASTQPKTASTGRRATGCAGCSAFAGPWNCSTGLQGLRPDSDVPLKARPAQSPAGRAIF